MSTHTCTDPNCIKQTQPQALCSTMHMHTDDIWQARRNIAALVAALDSLDRGEMSAFGFARACHDIGGGIIDSANGIATREDRWF